MNTTQLQRVLDEDRRTSTVFQGVFPQNHRPPQPHPPVGYILNTDPCDRPGVFFDREGHSEYFDSYGLPPLSPAITRWLTETTRRWTWNTQPLQSDTTAVCGQYCLFYAAHRARDVPMLQIMAMFTETPGERCDGVRCDRTCFPGRCSLLDHRLDLNNVNTKKKISSYHRSCCCCSKTNKKKLRSHQKPLCSSVVSGQSRLGPV